MLLLDMTSDNLDSESMFFGTEVDTLFKSPAGVCLIKLSEKKPEEAKALQFLTPAS